MVAFGSLSVSSAVVVLAMVVLSSSESEASGAGYGAPPPPPPVDTCVSPYLDTCIGDKATCQAYGLYKPGGYCPGQHSSYRRELSDDEDESGYGYAPQVGLDKFLCPCEKTLQTYFDMVLRDNGCSAGYGGGYGSADYSCNKCPGTSCSAGGHYRKLSSPGYGGSGGGGYATGSYSAGSHSSGGYVASGYASGGHVSGGYSFGGHGGGGYGGGAYSKATCSCATIEDAAIEKFCIAFVGDYRGGVGYGPGSGYGGYRKLDDSEEESYVPAAPLCSDCVKDCISYIKGCCSESVCKRAVGYGPGPGY